MRLQPRHGAQLTMSVPMNYQTLVPHPSYQRVHVKHKKALHIGALTLVTRLHLLTLCRLAVRLAHHRCPSPLPKGPGSVPRRYSDESLLLVALLKTLWRLSYQDMSEWLRSWPAASPTISNKGSMSPVPLNNGSVVTWLVLHSL